MNLNSNCGYICHEEQVRTTPINVKPAKGTLESKQGASARR